MQILSVKLDKIGWEILKKITVQLDEVDWYVENANHWDPVVRFGLRITIECNQMHLV